MDLHLQVNEGTVQRWQLWSRNVYLTSRRLVIYEGQQNCAVAPLEHISSVQTVTTTNETQRAWGGFLLGVGLVLAALDALGALRYLDYPASYLIGMPYSILVLGLVIAIVGIILLLTSRRTAVYVTLTSGENVLLAPKGYQESGKLREVMAALGDALAMPSSVTARQEIATSVQT